MRPAHGATPALSFLIASAAQSTRPTFTTASTSRYSSASGLRLYVSRATAHVRYGAFLARRASEARAIATRARVDHADDGHLFAPYRRHRRRRGRWARRRFWTLGANLATAGATHSSYPYGGNRASRGLSPRGGHGPGRCSRRCSPTTRHGAEPATVLGACPARPRAAAGLTKAPRPRRPSPPGSPGWRAPPRTPS